MTSKSQLSPKKSKNAFQRIQYTHPRIWAALVFFPFLFATIVLSPIAILFDVASECPRVFANFHRDFAEVWKRHTFNMFYVIKEAWKIWFNSSSGKQPLCEQKKKLEGNFEKED